MSEVLIKVEDLSKKFCRSLKRSMLYGTVDSLRTMIGIDYDPTILRKGEFFALTSLILNCGGEKHLESLGLMDLEKVHF